MNVNDRERASASIRTMRSFTRQYSLSRGCGRREGGTKQGGNSNCIVSGSNFATVSVSGEVDCGGVVNGIQRVAITGDGALLPSFGVDDGGQKYCRMYRMIFLTNRQWRTGRGTLSRAGGLDPGLLTCRGEMEGE